VVWGWEMKIKLFDGWDKARWVCFFVILSILPVSITYSIPRACLLGCGSHIGLCAQMVQTLILPFAIAFFMGIYDVFSCLPQTILMTLIFAVVYFPLAYFLSGKLLKIFNKLVRRFKK
jgi:L-lactate permease